MSHPSALTLDALQAALWNAGSLLRSTADPASCNNHLMAMLFFKCLCDRWQDRSDQFTQQYGDHPDLLEELLRNERFVVPPNARFDALVAQRHQPGNGERIDRALHALEDANLPQLRGLFHPVSFNSNALGAEPYKNNLLRRLLEDFAKPGLDLRPSRLASADVVGQACDFLVRNLSALQGRKAVDHATPPELASLMVQLASPQPGDAICDPVCGWGSLLVEAAQQLQRHGGSRNYALFGQEVSCSAWAMARMNLFLHDEDNHRVEWGDTLRNPRFLSDDEEPTLHRFDVVLAHPPFGLAPWPHAQATADPWRRFGRGMPPRAQADYAFISHMVESLKPAGGRLVVVVPHGVLFRGAAEASIRRRLVEENLIDAVIGLPDKLLYGTPVAAALLVLRTQRADDRVLFIDASRDFETGKSRNLLRPADMQRIVQTAQTRQAVPHYAYAATRQEIAAHGFNLNISRFVRLDLDVCPTDWTTVRAEREVLQAELHRLEGDMAACLNTLMDQHRAYG